MFAIDIETERFGEGYKAPRVVCLSYARIGGESGVLENPDQIRQALREWAPAGLVGLNVAYDLACLYAWGLAPDVWDWYAQDRVFDCGIFERIVEIGAWTAQKELSLAHLARVYGLGELDKGAIRTSFEVGRALTEEQRAYSLQDALATGALWKRQLARWGDRVALADVALLTRKAFWLHLVSAWGMLTDPSRVRDLEIATIREITRLRGLALDCGFLRPDGSRDMQAIQKAVESAYEGRAPRTKTGRVATSAEALKESGDPLLEEFASYGEWSAVLSKDLEFLRRPILHTRFQIANTTRTTSSQPNLQNLRRAAGVRECLIPRPGNVFIAIDHGGLELCTLAQCCVWYLRRRYMADQINAGIDLHSSVGSQILGISYADFRERLGSDKSVKQARGASKVVNFGRPGGLSAPTLVLYAKAAYGVILTLEEAQTAIRTWERANPDGMAYLHWIRSLETASGYCSVVPGTTIRRRQMTYCSAANSHFQGLGAVLEGEVGFEIAREGYESGLWRIAMFIHDEFLVECAEENVDYVARRLDQIMTQGPAVRKFLPDVQIRTEFAAMRRWSKDAKAVHDARGALIPWEDA